MNVQTLDPSRIAEKFYAAHVSLADFTDKGADAAPIFPFGISLSTREVITGAGFYIKDSLASGALTSALIELGIIKSSLPSVLSVIATVKDISDNSIDGDNYIGGMNSGINAVGTSYSVPTSAVPSSTFARSAVTIGGSSSTDQFILATATINDTVAVLNSEYSNNIPVQTTDFTQTNPRDILAKITLTGALANALTAGELYIYVWTKTIPEYVAR